jgi:hypothetical protein
MIEEVDFFLAKAEESFAGAESEFINDRFNNCANSQFIGQLINRRKVYPASLRNTLEDNRALRQAAGYKRENVTEVRASRAVRRTEDFLQAIREGGQ